MKLIYWNHFAAGFGVFLFRSSKCMDRTFSSDSLIYQRSGNMSDMFIQAQDTRGSQWQGKTGRNLSSEASVTWPPSGFLIVQELEMSPIIPEMDGFQWRFFFLRFPTALPNYWPLKRASPYTLF